MDELLEKINKMRETTRFESAEPLLLALEGEVADDGRLRPGAPWWVALELCPDGSTQVRWNGPASVDCRPYAASQDAEAVKTFQQVASLRRPSRKPPA
jgi:hypothetical protein